MIASLLLVLTLLRPRPTGSASLKLLSPLDQVAYLEGSEVWTNVHIEVEPSEPLAVQLATQDFQLCLELESRGGGGDDKDHHGGKAENATTCTSVRHLQELPNWTNLPGGDYGLCTWLRRWRGAEKAVGAASARDDDNDGGDEGAAALPLRQCVRFSMGRAALLAAGVPRRVLGVKFGQHGDDAAVTVASEGVLVSKRRLSDLWAAAASASAASAEAGASPPTALLSRRRQVASVRHPGGFCGACDAGDGASDAPWVSRAGSCEVCVPFHALVERWKAVFELIMIDHHQNDDEDIPPPPSRPVGAVIVAASPEDVGAGRAVDAIRQALESTLLLGEDNENDDGAMAAAKAVRWAVTDPYTSRETALAASAPQEDEDSDSFAEDVRSARLSSVRTNSAKSQRFRLDF